MRNKPIRTPDLRSVRAKTDCLLVVPPDVGYVFPRGAMELASYLRQRGYSISVVPLAHELNNANGEAGTESDLRRIIERLLADLRPAVIGISNLFTMHYPSCERIARICKETVPEVIIVMGGPHPTFLDLEVAASPWVDVVVRGEGEEALAELLEARAAGCSLQTVAGLTLGFASSVVRTPDRPVIEDLSRLPPLDLTLLPEDYLRSCQVYGFMNRGCAFSCAFCAEFLFWRRRRDYAVERVLDEMENFESRFGNPLVGIEDSMVYIGAEQFHTFCRGITERRLKLSPDFFVLSRVDTITSAGIESMQRAGIRNARLGIESGSPAVRRHMGKTFSDEKILDSCARLREADIETMAFWIIGHPGDDPEQSAISLRFLDRLLDSDLVARAVLSLFLPYPGTQFYGHPEAYGIHVLRHDWSAWQRWGREPACELEAFSALQISAAYEEALGILARHGQHLRQVPYEAEFSAYLMEWVKKRAG